MRRATRVLLSPFYLILLNLLFFVWPPITLAGDTIRMNGSGSGLEMIKPIMAAYEKDYRGVSFKMEKPLGSSGSIKALLTGAIDIAITSRPLKPEEIAQGGKPRYFGKTPLAIVTGKRIPLKTISTNELEDIYSGKKTKRPNGETIRVVLRPNEDIDTKILRGLSPGKLPHAAAKFLDFIYSKKGRAIAENTGVLITADGE